MFFRSLIIKASEIRADEKIKIEKIARGKTDSRIDQKEKGEIKKVAVLKEKCTLGIQEKAIIITKKSWIVKTCREIKNLKRKKPRENGV